MFKVSCFFDLFLIISTHNATTIYCFCATNYIIITYVYKSLDFILFLVPPDIINEDSSVDMAVQEGEDAALTCRATGNPVPRVTWKKEDGDFILIRKQGNRDLMKGN